MQQQQQQPVDYQVSGTLQQVDNSRNFKPLRVSVTDTAGQTRWYSAFDEIGRSLAQAGEGSGPWILTYTESPWSRNGKSGMNYTVKQAVFSGQVQQPVQQPVQQQQYQQPVQQVPPAQYTPDVPAWSLNLTDKDRCIIRQVAFKGAIDICGADGDPSMVNNLTNAFEHIIKGTYQPADPADEQPPFPDAPPPPDDQFMQAELNPPNW